MNDCDALDYLKDYYDNGRLASDVTSIEPHVAAWKRALRKEKQQLNVQRLEKLSEEPLDMNTITEFVENPEMWAKFDSVIKSIQQGEELP